MDDVTCFPLDSDTGLRPFEWSKRLVISGAAEAGLLKAYVERLRRVSSMEDPS
ncbi:hypothetical protein ACFLTM_04390 [Candidatus Bipolaricaulota bacterium]